MAGFGAIGGMGRFGVGLEESKMSNGRRTLSGVWVTVFWSLLSVSGSFAADDLAKSIRNTPKRTTIPAKGVDVPIGIDEGQILVNAMINGKGPFTLLVDTGIANIVLDDGVVARADLSVLGPVRFEDRSLIIADAANLVQIGKLAIGEATFEGVSAMVVDLNLQLGRARGLDGIIGLSAFADCLLTIDFPGQLLRLERGGLPSVNGRDVLDLKYVEGWPTVDMVLGKFKAGVGIDTTVMNAMIIGGRQRHDVSLSAPPIKERSDRLISDVDLGQSVLNGTLHIGKYELSEVPAVLMVDPTRVGYGVLGQFSISFDSKNGRIRFGRKGGDSINFTQHSRFGLVLRRVRTVLEIVYIVPGSPADAGHMTVGQTIIAIEGREPRRYKDEQLRELFRTADSILFKVDTGYAHLNVVMKAQ